MEVTSGDLGKVAKSESEHMLGEPALEASQSEEFEVHEGAPSGPESVSSPKMDPADMSISDFSGDEADNNDDEGEQNEYNDNGRLRYLKKCELLNVVPATAILARLGEPVIRLRHHGLGARGAIALAEMLKVNHTISKLDVTGTFTNAEGAAAIFEALAGENGTLTSLRASGNRIGDEETIMTLENMTAQNEDEEEDEEKVEEEETDPIRAKLKKMAVRGTATDALANMLINNGSLRVLDLSSNGLGDRFASAIGEGLKLNTGVNRLNLSHNDFTDIGAEQLGRCMADWKEVKSLDLSFNQMRHKAGVALGMGLALNTSLESLNLAWNGIGEEGGSALVDGLAQNSTITKLGLSHCRLGKEAVTHLAAALVANRNIRVLDISANALGDEGLEDLVAKIRERCSYAMSFKGKFDHSHDMDTDSDSELTVKAPIPQGGLRGLDIRKCYPSDAVIGLFRDLVNEGYIRTLHVDLDV